MVKEGPTRLTANIKGTLHTKQRNILRHIDAIYKYREVQSDYNIRLDFNFILDLREVAKTVSRGKLFHNGMTLGKKAFTEQTTVSHGDDY